MANLDGTWKAADRPTKAGMYFLYESRNGSWRRIVANQAWDCHQGAQEIADAHNAAMEIRHPRIAKLDRQGRAFVPVGEHEPYYMAVYEMIRTQERDQDTWTPADEVAFHAAMRRAQKLQRATRRRIRRLAAAPEGRG